MKRKINFKVFRKCIKCKRKFKINSSQQRLCIACRFLKCIICKKTFKIKDYSDFKRYCFKKCQLSINNLEIYAQKGNTPDPWNKGKSSLPFCVDCKVKLKDHRSKRCRSCSAKFDERFVGEKNSNWKNGITKKKGYDYQKSKRWAKNNPEKYRFVSHKSRLKRRNVIGSHTLDEWEKVKKIYGYMCLCCKRTEPEIKLTEDHIIPLIKGGTDYIWNIQPLCFSCNSRKNIKEIDYRNDFTSLINNQLMLN